MMKKTLMFTASLMLGSAGVAQSTVNNAGEASANAGYPACSRTVTDSCIQLYERGVRTSANLAMNRNMTPATGMGGPYEPVTTTHSSATMDDGTANVGIMSDTTAKPATHSGVGGPAEARTGYPACDPGPGDDSCIQLYERGVTGAKN
jgi:hypothetical protein